MKRLSFALTFAALVGQAVAQDAIYDRPFVANLGSSTTAVGGYLEGNTNYFAEDGVSEGFSMELRRFNVFLYSTMGRRVSFFSELEFEHGTEEIALETALMDVELNQALTFRAGIVLPPLGYFNQNHDSPKWEFVDRPLVSTQIIPSTLSEVGFGVYGRRGVGELIFDYQAYVVNGLSGGVVSNADGRTSIPAGKSEEAFGEDNNGTPAWTGRVGVSSELGAMALSAYSGVYNDFRLEGDDVDERRRLTILALDVQSSVGPVELVGEGALAFVNVPDALGDLFGDRQVGGHLDLIYPIRTGSLAGFSNARLNAVVRLEYVDLNVGSFADGSNRFDDERVIVAGITFRPNQVTALKANYRTAWIRDLLGNPARLGGVQFGFATYF